MGRKDKEFVEGWCADGREIVHFFPVKDSVVHRLIGAAGCRCEPEVELSRYERLVYHQCVDEAEKRFKKRRQANK